MARINALILAGAIGAALGTILHPGILEVGIVAVVLIVAVYAVRGTRLVQTNPDGRIEA